MKQSTLQEQYNLITEGKGNQEVFLKEAKRQFPNLIRNSADLNETVNSLKHNHIISENNLRMGVVVTDKNTTPDWFKIFNENIQEAKAEEKKPTKEVVDLETAGFDYKDLKNVDNVFGEEFLRGYYTEMKDPKNSEKTVDELKEIVAKNLAKDRTHYVKDGQFGIKGVGYTDKAPGLGIPKEAKGKHKSSGYGDLDKKLVKENYEQEPNLTQPSKPKSNEFSVVHYNGEVAILKDKNGKLYSFVYDFIPREDFADYAEVPETYIGKDEEGFPEYEYGDDWEIDGAVLYGYINDNAAELSRGFGVDDYDAGKDIVEIDSELKDYLLRIHDKDKKLVAVLRMMGKKMVKESKDFEGTGLIVVGKTQLDTNAIRDMIDETDYYGIFNVREGYWFFPEDEETLDSLEMELEREFNDRGIDARFESQLDENETPERKILPNKDPYTSSTISIKSALERIIQQVWGEKDINKAKTLVIDFLSQSKVNDASKSKMINTIKAIDKKYKLDYFLANSLLKFERMGLSETTTKYISLEKMINEAEYYLSHTKEKKKKKKEVKEEKPLVGDKIKEIEEKGTIASLESKIAALDEEINNRHMKLKMIGENEDLAEFINPSKINEMKREIKELEKAKGKYQKMYEKMVGKAKKEIIDEKETE
jgi:hypothetical protein